jgi:hypothetical protein
MKNEPNSFHHATALPFIFVFIVTAFGCNNPSAEKQNRAAVNDSSKVASMLDSFHIAAAKADFLTYFDFYTEDAIFIGTDATERWNKTRFKAYAKPYFDKGKAWIFTSLERHIYFDKTGSLGWFDELLNTQMKICRGSGVVVKLGADWKVQQYVLSMTIPNSQSDTIVKMKTIIEEGIIHTLSKK